MNVDWMYIHKGSEACSIHHKINLDWKKYVDKYQGAVQERQSTLLSLRKQRNY